MSAHFCAQHKCKTSHLPNNSAYTADVSNAGTLSLLGVLHKLQCCTLEMLMLIMAIAAAILFASCKAASAERMYKGDLAW